MATYTQSRSNVIGGTYFQGIIKPWDDYICISLSDTSSILVVGDYDGLTGNTLKFKNSTIYRVNRTTGANFSYSTTVSEEATTSVTVSEPYYTYSNTYSGSPALNCTSSTTIMGYFVCFCCVLYVINNVIGHVIRSVIRDVGN